MRSSSCFYTCIQRTCSRKFSYLLLHIKRTPAKNPASVPTVSLYNHISISYKSYRNLFHSHIFSIYENDSNRLTWSNILTLVPSGFASLLFSRFAFKNFFTQNKIPSSNNRPSGDSRNPHWITGWFVFFWQEDPEETGRTAGTDRGK